MNERFRHLGRQRTNRFLLWAALSTIACSDAAVNPVTVASIDISPATATARAGATIVLSAQPKDANGSTVSTGIITWSSSDPAVAIVSAAGVVTTRVAGKTIIAASAFGKSATSAITVTAREVATVVVNPPSVSIRLGGSVQLQAQTLDADNAALTGRTVTWSSNNPSVATVTTDGTITGRAIGAATITATSEGRAGQAAVTVTLLPVQTVSVTPSVDTLAIGTQRQHTAVLRDESGAVLTGRVLAWSSNNVAVATVSSSGVVSALAPGSVTITASSGGRIGTSTVVVQARLAGAVILTPSSSTLIVGATSQLTTQVTDSSGNLLTGRPVTYSSNAPAVASISGTGIVTAVSPGTAQITAVSEGKSGTAFVQVIPVPVSTVELTPATITIQPGAQQQLTVVARAANGIVLNGRTVTWTSGSNGIATVSNSGLVAGVSPGVVLILASVDGVSASAQVTVRLPPVASIGISPNEPSLAVSESVQLTATLRDADGTLLTGRNVAWSSTDESVAFVTSSGVVLAFKTGTARITATSEGVSASTLVTVR